MIKFPAERRSFAKLSAAILLLSMLVFLVAVVASPASANHAGKSLNVAPELGTAAADNVATATLTGSIVSASSVVGAIIQFEVDSGPADPDTPDSNSPTSPDKTCTVASGNSCSVTIGPSNVAGVSIVRAWIEHGDAAAITPADELDTTEGRSAASEPGSIPETPPDSTDVVQVTWGGAAGQIDATPETASNVVNTVHTVTAVVKTAGASGVAVYGANVDFRVTAGPNSTVNLADNKTPASTAQGYFGDCATDATGTCTRSYTSTVTGTDTITVWVDLDGDNALDANEPTDPGGVQKTWTAGPTATQVSATPTTASNQTGTSHTVTATAKDSATPTPNPVNGANVDFQVTAGPNSTVNLADNKTPTQSTTPGYFGDCTTAGTGATAGQCTRSYTSTVTGTDTITVWIDSDGDDVKDTAEPSTTVSKTWTATPTSACGTPPAGYNVINGTAGADNLAGTAGNDFICGLAGDDLINALGGNDIVIAGDGNDKVGGGAGDDLMFGQVGNDIIYGSAGADRVSGGDGNDRISLGDGADRGWGVAGDDRLWGGAGTDRIYGNTGDDVIYGNSEDDALVGSAGADAIVGGSGKDRMYGLADADRLFARDGVTAETVNGGTGLDVCSSDPGDFRTSC